MNHRVSGDHRFSDRCHRHAGKFHVLPGEGNTDDRYRKESGEKEVPECQPPASNDEPDDVAQQAKSTRPEVFVAGHLLAVDDFLAKGP